MSIIKIDTKQNQYNIVIKNNSLEDIHKYIDLSKFSKIVILTDENIIQNKWIEKLSSYISKPVEIIETQSGEINKSLDTISYIWRRMNEIKMDRKSLLINVGGGVVCDMGGFCASTYMRGIDFIQIPTTLLSQVDASVGGKTGFDFNGVKNCIGTFAEPVSVIIDSNTLSTLPQREYISGMAEVIKYGIIFDKNFLNYLDKETINNEYIIQRSCEIKAEVVKKDFKESGIRKILNYGHTIGHAIESLSIGTDNELLHGEAVAIGMIGEAYIAHKIGYISYDEFTFVHSIVKKLHLPSHCEGNLDTIYSMLFKDKKNVSSKIKWVLPKGLGGFEFDVEVEENIIKEAIQFILK